MTYQFRCHKPREREQQDEDGHPAHRELALGSGDEEEDGGHHDREQQPGEPAVAARASGEREDRVPRHGDGVDLLLGRLGLQDARKPLGKLRRELAPPPAEARASAT